MLDITGRVTRRLFAADRSQPPPAREVQLSVAVPDANVANRILSSPAWQSAANQQAIINIAQASSDSGDAWLADLTERSPVLAQTDAHGNSLLDNLDTLATQSLHGKILRDGGGEITRSELMDSTLADLADPTAQVTQNGANTCASTSVQIALARDDPAEYVRLLVGLSGEDGSVRMRGGGRLGLQQESFDDGGIVGEKRRSASEVIFQGAAVEFANGSNIDYNAREDGHDIGGWMERTPLGNLDRAREWISPEIGGLSANMQSSLLRNVFGQDYRTQYGDANLVTGGLAPMGAGEGQRAHDYLAAYGGQQPVEFTFQFLDAGIDITKAHAVLFDHVDAQSGRVYFQNPWGNGVPSSDSSGLVDPAQPDLFYLEQDDFVNNVIWVVAPTGGVYPAPQPVVEVPTGTTSTTIAPASSAGREPSAPSTTVADGPPTGTTTTTTLSGR